MNNLQKKIEILQAMDKGLTIQYSETDGEKDDWKDLKTIELDFSLYTYRVKPRHNFNARFKVGDKIVNLADEGKVNPPIFTVKDFDDMGNYLWEESYNRSPIDVTDANCKHIDEVYWWHVIHYKKEDKYTLAPTMMKLGEVKGWANETYSPIFEIGFRIPRGEQDDNRKKN